MLRAIHIIALLALRSTHANEWKKKDEKKQQQQQTHTKMVTKYRCANRAIDDSNSWLRNAQTNNKGIIIALLLSY